MKCGAALGEASLLLQSSAFFTVFLGAILLKEKITIPQITGGVIAFEGIFLIFNGVEGSSTLIGTLFVLLAAFSWSITNIIVKIGKPTEMLSFIIWSSIFSPIPLLAFAYFTNDVVFNMQRIFELNGLAWFSILFQAYPVTLLGYWVWNKLLAKYPVSSVAPLSLLVPVFGVLRAVLFYQESVTLELMISGALIILGLMINMGLIKAPKLRQAT